MIHNTFFFSKARQPTPDTHRIFGGVGLEVFLLFVQKDIAFGLTQCGADDGAFADRRRTLKTHRSTARCALPSRYASVHASGTSPCAQRGLPTTEGLSTAERHSDGMMTLVNEEL